MTNDLEENVSGKQLLLGEEVAGKWKDRDEPPRRKTTQSRSSGGSSTTSRRTCLSCKGKTKDEKAACKACGGDGYIDLKLI